MKKLILIISCLFIFNNPVVALVEVDITRGNLDPLPIAVSPIYIESVFNKACCCRKLTILSLCMAIIACDSRICHPIFAILHAFVFWCLEMLYLDTILPQYWHSFFFGLTVTFFNFSVNLSIATIILTKVLIYY